MVAAAACGTGSAERICMRNTLVQLSVVLFATSLFACASSDPPPEGKKSTESHLEDFEGSDVGDGDDSARFDDSQFGGMDDGSQQPQSDTSDPSGEQQVADSNGVWRCYENATSRGVDPSRCAELASLKPMIGP